MSHLKLTTILIFVMASQICRSQNVNITTNRDSKLFSMFQIVKFPNDPCVGTNSRNGTCFTSSECTTKAGTSSGSCAQGFGVCCTFILGCGSSAAQNCTYVENTGASAGSCKYSICKCNTNICQLRLDFISFVITGPSTRSISVAQKVTNPVGVQSSDATQCVTDTFTVSSPLSTVPVLCGTLTNDHIYVEASPSCNDLVFTLGSASPPNTVTIPTRSWQIKVTQYSCDYSNKAPEGCLQYFYGTSGTGTVRSFNYGASTPYHLANQKQSICVRRESGQCKICWYAPTAITDFQLSGMVATPGIGYATGTKCCTYAAGIGTNYDCVMIPGASNGIGVMKSPSVCGRQLVTAIGTTAATVCSKQTPFQISFFSDNWENTAEIAAAILEAGQTRSGFQLTYVQSSTNC